MQENINGWLEKKEIALKINFYSLLFAKCVFKAKLINLIYLECSEFIWVKKLFCNELFGVI